MLAILTEPEQIVKTISSFDIGSVETGLQQVNSRQSIKRGYRVLYRPLHHLVDELYAGRADGTFPKVYTNILRVDVLILDDFGLVPLSPHGAQDLYEIIRDRYERKSIILTSNRAPEEWGEVFGNSLLASAALDRLTHHSQFIEMAGESYRQRQRRLDTGGLITGEKEVRQQNTSEEKGGDM
ncbi:MAG: ATP-binding protein [Candidatus Bipolaricaulota bacterium]|nr:ATP-binding protein [Candidatus Bipolaricaulota bacterium]